MSRMKWFTGLVVLVMALSFTGVSAAQKIPLKAASYIVKPALNNQGMIWWYNELEKRTNGRVQPKGFFGGTLASGPDTITALGKGIMDVAFIFNGYTPGKIPLTTVGELIYVTMKTGAHSYALTDLYNAVPAFREEWTSQNIKVLGFLPIEPVIIGSKKPIKTLEELKGKKIRAVGWLSQVMKMFGATPVAMPTAEEYEALQRGVIEGYTGNVPSLAYQRKWYEVAKYMMEPRMGCYCSSLAGMNLDYWKRLPKDVQEVIEDLNKELTAKQVELVLENEQTILDKLIKEGTTLYTIPDAEYEKAKKIVLPELWNDWVNEMNAKGLPGRETLDKFLDLVKKYEPEDPYHRGFPAFKKVFPE
jgi:TRAP-type C4-dicarboxylate transport system substrate-binding protein